VEFFDSALEVCDATIQYVEEHLDQVGGTFLPNSIWCPWRSRLIAEIQPDITPIATATSESTALPTLTTTATPTPTAMLPQPTPTTTPTTDMYLPAVINS
jgi:hypothetical protein